MDRTKNAASTLATLTELFLGTDDPAESDGLLAEARQLIPDLSPEEAEQITELGHVLRRTQPRR